MQTWPDTEAADFGPLHATCGCRSWPGTHPEEIKHTEIRWSGRERAERLGMHLKRSQVQEQTKAFDSRDFSLQQRRICAHEKNLPKATVTLVVIFNGLTSTLDSVQRFGITQGVQHKYHSIFIKMLKITTPGRARRMTNRICLTGFKERFKKYLTLSFEGYAEPYSLDRERKSD